VPPVPKSKKIKADSGLQLKCHGQMENILRTKMQFTPMIQIELCESV